LPAPYSLKNDSGRDPGIAHVHALVCQTLPMRLNGSPDCKNKLQNNVLSGAGWLEANAAIDLYSHIHGILCNEIFSRIMSGIPAKGEDTARSISFEILSTTKRIPQRYILSFTLSLVNLFSFHELFKMIIWSSRPIHSPANTIHAIRKILH
jgi:hypothetical protein